MTRAAERLPPGSGVLLVDDRAPGTGIRSYHWNIYLNPRSPPRGRPASSRNE